jgi:hypothetical protein
MNLASTSLNGSYTFILGRTYRAVVSFDLAYQNTSESGYGIISQLENAIEKKQVYQKHKLAMLAGCYLGFGFRRYVFSDVRALVNIKQCFGRL